MTEQMGDPWRVTELDFPTSGSTEEQLHFLLGYAILAPSSHNTQPWAFRIGTSHVDLFADRSRRLSVVDPDDRELTISCGAALYYLRLAAHCFGFRVTVEPVPDRSEPDLLARVRIAPDGDAASTEEHALLTAIPRRRTNRATFAQRPAPPHLLDALGEAAEAEGAWFRVASGERERATVAALIAEGDRLQWSDPAFRRELASWMRPDRTTRRDGMPGSGFGVGEIESLAAPILMRTFDMGRGRAAKDQELALGSPVLAVLGTEADTPEARLDAGQAVARVLLLATVNDLSASFLNQPNEIPSLRTRLAEALDQRGWPQMLMRLGYGPPGPHTPRRSVDDVVFT